MIIKVFVNGPLDANNYLLIDEETKEAVLIDCSTSNDKFVEDIKSLGVKLKYILLTHGHFDHILGVDKFKKVFGVETYVSKSDIEQIQAAPQMMQFYGGIEPFDITTINHFVKEGNIFTIGKTEIKAIETPGHTQGGMSYLADGKIFSGDTLFQTSVGRTDLPGGDLRKIVHSVKDVLFAFPDETEVFPGHGDKTTIGYEKKFNEILNI